VTFIVLINKKCIDILLVYQFQIDTSSESMHLVFSNRVDTVIMFAMYTYMGMHSAVLSRLPCNVNCPVSCNVGLFVGRI
jgi:hypothetical protein